MARQTRSESQILTEIPAPKPSRWYWVIVGLTILLLLVGGGYCSFRMQMTLPGDGGANLEPQSTTP